jgi:hypothetical protein
MGINDIGTSELTRVWAHDATLAAVNDSRYTNGYADGDEPPANEHNTLFNEIGEKLNHCLQRGVANWVTTKPYTTNDVASHEGRIYIALTNNTASEPTPSNANWQQVLSERALAEFLPFSIGQPPRTTSLTQVQLPAGLITKSSTGVRMPANSSALTASINSSGANGLDTGTKANDTWYWLYYVTGTAGQALLFSANASSPTLPSGYTLFRNLRTPFRTNGDGNLAAMVYDGFGTGVHTGYYTQPDYTNYGRDTMTGGNVALNGGNSTSFALVTVTLVPVDSTAGQFSWMCRTNTVTLRKPDATYSVSISTGTPDTVDFSHTTWLELGGTGRQIEYRVSSQNTSIICTGFKLPAV